MPSAKQPLLEVSWVSSKRWPLNMQIFVYINIFLYSYANCSTPLPLPYTWLSPPHHGWEKLCGELLVVHVIICFGFDFWKMPWVILGVPRHSPCSPHCSFQWELPLQPPTRRHWLQPKAIPGFCFSHRTAELKREMAFSGRESVDLHQWQADAWQEAQSHKMSWAIAD